MDAPRPEPIERVLAMEARDQTPQLLHRLRRVPVERNAILDLEHLELCPRPAQPVARGLDAVDPDVAVDEPTPQPVGNSRRDAAAPKEVRHEHTLVAAGPDDALQQSLGLLGGVVIFLPKRRLRI